jgi:cytochrome P450
VVHLAQRPELRRQIIDDPKQLPVVLEEILRFDSPVQYLTRTATRDVEIHGKVIPEGARVLAMYASANRDERVFENAEEFDPSRPTKRHLAFGEGIHFCIGAGLGRLEARIAVELLLESFPDYEIDGDPVRFHHSHFRRFASVPFKFDMAKRRAAAEAGTA